MSIPASFILQLSFLVCLLDEVASRNEVWPSIASNVWSFMRRNCHRSVQRATARDEEPPRCMRSDRNRNQWLRLNMILESVREPSWSWVYFNSLTWWCHCSVCFNRKQLELVKLDLHRAGQVKGSYRLEISCCRWLSHSYLNFCQSENSNFNARWQCCLKVERR